MGIKQGAWAVHATIHGGSDANATFTNMPAADTFLFSSSRHIIKIDLEGMTYMRFKVNKQGTAGSTGARLIVRASQTFSTTVGNYSDVCVSELSVVIDVTNTFLETEWIEIKDEFKGDVFVCVVGNGGNGTLDPVFGNISISVC